MPAGTVWRIAWSRLLQVLGMQPPPLEGITPQHQQIVWLIRMPRVLLAALVGAGLAVVGTIMQAMVRNPLADPYLLGVSSGASVGAVAVLAFGALASAGMYALTAGAFAGALAATLAVYLLARSQGRIHASRLILGGVAIGYVLAGVTSLITLSSGQRDLANALLTWTLGSLAGTQWEELGIPAAVLAAGMLWLGCRRARSTPCWPVTRPPPRWAWTRHGCGADCSWRCRCSRAPWWRSVAPSALWG